MAEVRVLGGRYRLVEHLGSGGMSVVWRAYDEVLGRQVAVKVLPAGLVSDGLSRSQIRTEAQQAARLAHPYITSVHDYGESSIGDDECVPFVVMELVNGPTLADRLAEGPVPVSDALRICAQVAAALAAAHARGVVHRDIKPANIMLSTSGAKVLDFGIAAVAGEADIIPADGKLWGTPAYLAPERVEGGSVVAASDVYALGLLLYRLLAGELPWNTSTVTQMIEAHMYVEPAPLPRLDGVHGTVREVVARCLAKDPSERPAAGEVARLLAAASGRESRTAVAPVDGPPDDAEVDTRVVASVRRAMEPPARAAAPTRRPKGRKARGRDRSAAGAVAPAAGAVAPAAAVGILAEEAGMLIEPVSQSGSGAPGRPVRPGRVPRPRSGDAGDPGAGTAGAGTAGDAGAGVDAAGSAAAGAGAGAGAGDAGGPGSDAADSGAAGAGRGRAAVPVRGGRPGAARVSTVAVATGARPRRRPLLAGAAVLVATSLVVAFCAASDRPDRGSGTGTSTGTADAESGMGGTGSTGSGTGSAAGGTGSTGSGADDARGGVVAPDPAIQPGAAGGNPGAAETPGQAGTGQGGDGSGGSGGDGAPVDPTRPPPGPSPVDTPIDTIAGTVTVRCTGPVAEIIGLPPGVRTPFLNKGPGAEVGVTLKLLVTEVTVTVTCVDGRPKARIG